MAHSSFFTSFRSNVLGPSVSGPLLPPHLFQRFITEFSFNFRSEIHEEYFDDSESSSFEKSEAILWKDILRQQNINLKFDHSTEKRIRAGLVNFITTNATPRHLPSGNSSRQYFIPKELSTKFTNWFQDHVITGFKEFDLKRKTSNLTDTVKTKKIKSSGDEIPHRVLDLEVEVDNLDLELVPADEYAWCLTFRLVSIDDEKSKMIMMWLLVRMKGKFPACKIRDGRGFGIPKELSE